MKTKRESELVALKRSVEEETVAHEAAMAQLRQKHTQLVEELNVQLETTKKVWSRYYQSDLCWARSKKAWDERYLVPRLFAIEDWPCKRDCDGAPFGRTGMVSDKVFFLLN